MVYKIQTPQTSLPTAFTIEILRAKKRLKRPCVSAGEGSMLSHACYRNCPVTQIVYDSQGFSVVAFASPRKTNLLKTIVRPEFSKYGRITMSEAALTQMVIHCLDEFDQLIKVTKVNMKIVPEGYKLTVKLRVPMKHQIASTLSELQEYIGDSLEKYGGIFVAGIDLEIEEWS